MYQCLFVYLAFLFVHLTYANVEKVIFLGPETVNIPQTHPSLDDLKLHVLTPSSPSIRTHVEVEFSSEVAKGGRDTWLLLDNLTEGARYEVRICWAAVQPTSFTLSTHTLPSVFETPELISSLAAYSEARQTADSSASSTNSGTNVEHGGERQASVLFLRIQAAADFFADDAALMSAPPAVLADVILDPYVGGVIPRSLVPTVCYVLVIAMAAWLVSKYVVGWVADMNGGSEKASKDQEVSVDAEGEERNAGVVRRKRRRVA